MQDVRNDEREHGPVALFEGPKVSLFRGWALVALVAVCVGVGAGAHSWWSVFAAARARNVDVTITLAPPQEASSDARVAWPMKLPGPNGTTVELSGTAVVHVWLQGCPDCMPSFEAMKRLRQEHALDAHPTFNVAYGSADPAWAAQYGVDRALAFDAGAQFVQPLGIGTFTTLVIGSDGSVTRIGAPTAPDYVKRTHDALAAARERESPTAGDARTAEALGYLRGRSRELAPCLVVDRSHAQIRSTVTIAHDGHLIAAPLEPAYELSAGCVRQALSTWNIGSAAPKDSRMVIDVVLSAH